MEETYYFSHDYNSRSDPKIMNLRMKHGIFGVGVFWCIVEMLYEQSGYLMQSDCERIAYELHTDNDTINSILRDFDLFRFNDTMFWSESVLRRIDKRKIKSEKARESSNKRWKTSERNAKGML